MSRARPPQLFPRRGEAAAASLRDQSRGLRRACHIRGIAQRSTRGVHIKARNIARRIVGHVEKFPTRVHRDRNRTGGCRDG